MGKQFLASIERYLYKLALGALITAAACQPVAPASPEASAPGFTLPAANGNQVSLSDYSGRPVLLYFHMANG